MILLGFLIGVYVVLVFALWRKVRGIIRKLMEDNYYFDHEIAVIFCSIAIIPAIIIILSEYDIKPPKWL